MSEREVTAETLTDEHPVHRLERAAMEYAKAARSSSVADIRASRIVQGHRRARADLLAARARRRKIDSSTLLQSAADAFAAWSATRRTPGPP